MPHATRRTGLTPQVQIREKSPCLVYLLPVPVSFRACLFRCWRGHQKRPFAYERSESQTSAPKHLEPLLESVRGPAGLEAETVPAQLGEPTLGFGRSTQAAGDTQPCTGAHPQQLSPSLPHTGAAQPFHHRLSGLGWGRGWCLPIC